MSKQVLRLADGVNIEPRHDESSIDCRLLFMADRYRQLLRAYPELIYRLSRTRPPAEVLAFVNESAEIAQYYEVGGDDSKVWATLRDSVFRDAAPPSSLDLYLHVGRKGHWDRYPLTLPLLAVLGRLVPLLQGDFSSDEIARRVEAFEPADRQWAQGLLDLLHAEHALETVPQAQNSFLKSPARPRTTFVAHTSILLQTRTTAIVTDPLLRFSLHAPREAVDAARLPLNAICLTHAHWDHCDIQSLLLFDKATPVVIPRVHEPTIFNPPMAPVLKLLGFTDIREVDPWDRLQLGDIEAIFVPFHGEQDEPDAVIDHYTYVFKTEGLSLYGGVDSFRDTFGEMPAALARVREEHKPTVAFLPISRMVYSYRHGGVNGFCRYMDTSMLDRSFQYTAGAAEAAQWVRELNVDTVVPYATFTFNPRATPGEVADLLEALRQADMSDRLLPLPTQGAVEPSDLDGSAKALRRRRTLQQWFATGARASRLDRRLKQIPAYRFARRLMSGAGGPPAHHH
jgi:L-ascorbate metabolism protein UlaG (beta-lactamase superfamily)